MQVDICQELLNGWFSDMRPLRYEMCAGERSGASGACFGGIN